MKKVSLFLLLLVPLAMMAENVTKIAVLETVDKAGNVEYGKRLYVRNTLTRAIAGTPGYEAYDRVDISSIFKELDFQRTGNVSEDQIKELGKMTGAQYVLVPEIAKMDANTFYITAKILDVETAQAVSVSGATSTTEVFSMQEACIQMANELLALPSQRKAKQEKQERQLAKQQEQKKVTEGHLKEMGWEYHNKMYYERGYPLSRAKVDKRTLEAMRIKDIVSYNYYKKRCKSVIDAGWAMFAIGTASAITFPFLISAEMREEDLTRYYNLPYGSEERQRAEEAAEGHHRKAEELEAGWISLVSITAVTLSIAIPCLTAGYVKKVRICDDYLLGTSTQKKNYSCNMPNSPEQPYVTIGLQASVNGFGLGMRF